MRFDLFLHFIAILAFRWLRWFGQLTAYRKQLEGVRSAIDAQRTVLKTRQYAPYGTLQSSSGTAQTAFGFTGEWTDPNDLLYLRARYYAPQMGVFTALDPFEGMPGHPMSLNGYLYVDGDPVNDAVGELLGLLNGYSYANSNPVNMTDPTGLFAIPNSISASFAEQANQGFCENNQQNSSCKLEVAGYMLAPGAGHLLLIFTDERGNEFEYRAGPGASDRSFGGNLVPGCNWDNSGSEPFGSLCASHQPFRPGAGIDANRQFLLFERTTIMQGSEACEKRRCLNHVVDTLNAADLAYAPVPGLFGGDGVNSNTFVMTAAVHCNIPLNITSGGRVYPGSEIFIVLPQ